MAAVAAWSPWAWRSQHRWVHIARLALAGTGMAFVLLQHCLPKRLITALVYRIARFESQPFKDFLIRHFTRLYAVNTDEAMMPAEGWRSFNAFFTRALKPGARTVTPDSDALACPCDGTVAERGDIVGRRTLLRHPTPLKTTPSMSKARTK